MDQSMRVVADGEADGEGARSEVVLVPVPAQHLSRVYALLAELMRQPASAGRPRITTPPASPPQRGASIWSTREHYAALARRPLNSATRAMLDRCAAHPGERVSFADVLEATGLDANAARGQLSSFTRMLRREFPEWGIRDYHEWPLRVEWGPGGEAFYRMSPDQAAWWSEVAGGR